MHTTSDPTITVLGATGNVGGAICRRLLDAGAGVRAVGRSAERLAPLAGLGASARVGDATDAAFLADAFAGADAVFTLLPYDPTEADYFRAQTRFGEATVRAVREAGVPCVVFLSSVGAELAAGSGFVVSLHDQERRLAALADTVDVRVLRPGFFFENFCAALEVIEQHGVHGDTIAPDVRIPMVATGDVAEVAAETLLARGGPGLTVRELHGERDLSMREATRILGEHLGRPELPYVQMADAELGAALGEAGFSAEMVALHLELNRALSDGTVRPREPRSAHTTPRRRWRRSPRTWPPGRPRERGHSRLAVMSSSRSSRASMWATSPAAAGVPTVTSSSRQASRSSSRSSSASAGSSSGVIARR